MNKAIFAAIAILVATGGAFAGSEHFDPNNAGQQAAAVDTTATASTVMPGMARHDMKPAGKIAADEPGQGIWGRH
ncbi:DUF680 domain-containing protein [Mesorhizobium sp. CU2]|uniref:DUF680 domain-containing protein n=1 Tax=unclassified Mesorhizobium TaxID=325217 RepID=UPI00112ED9EA|nr:MULTISPECIES: DUF680 domain-containing protein [unclassified Mesorhizobium]TPN76151.1 DUF680 domain-containing protein [Mesorhizobium sp. CU3]TPO10732.1 DUF680 domain-containing protein [Mesorhizobium sp. CU2]